MRVLGIETATRRASVALWADGACAARAHVEEPMRHAERSLGLVDEAFARAKWAKGSIDLVACGTGPGSFTGVRVAIATAKGIAMGLGRPIVGVPSLEAMARAFGSEADRIVCLLDARKGEAFFAAYDGAGRLLAGPKHLPTAAVAEQIASLGTHGTVVAVGEMAADLALPAAVIVHRSFATDLPDAETVARLGAERMATAGPDRLHDLEPGYVRPPDITTPHDAGGGGRLSRA